MATLHQWKSYFIRGVASLEYKENNHQEKFEDTKAVIRSSNIDNTIAKRTRANNDLKTLHRKMKTKQLEPHQKLGVNSGAPEGLTVQTLLINNCSTQKTTESTLINTFGLFVSCILDLWLEQRIFYMTIHSIFLPSLVSIGQVVLEKNIEILKFKD